MKCVEACPVEVKRELGGGVESRNWLEKQIMDEYITVKINPRLRVGKWGRLLGEVIFEGINLNEQSMREGFARKF